LIGFFGGVHQRMRKKQQQRMKFTYSSSNQDVGFFPGALFSISKLQPSAGDKENKNLRGNF